MFIPEVKKDLENNKIVIFDACFYHKEAIEHLSRNLTQTQYIFTLKMTVEECIERDSERDRKYGEEAARAVHNLVSKFDYGINIDANKNIEDVIKEIISYLPK